MQISVKELHELINKTWQDGYDHGYKAAMTEETNPAADVYMMGTHVYQQPIPAPDPIPEPEGVIDTKRAVPRHPGRVAKEL